MRGSYQDRGLINVIKGSVTANKNGKGERVQQSLNRGETTGLCVQRWNRARGCKLVGFWYKYSRRPKRIHSNKFKGSEMALSYPCNPFSSRKPTCARGQKGERGVICTVHYHWADMNRGR